MSGSNPTSDADGDGRRLVLIVDDTPTIRTVVRASLRVKADRYRSIEAGNGSDALRLAGEVRPDIVLLDVALPDHDGFWVCRQLKTNAATARIPVVMLTAMSLPSDRERAMQAGADGYIVKPFSPRALLAELDQRLFHTDGSE